MAKRAGREANSQRRGYWSEQISLASRSFTTFQTSGERVVDRYRIEKADNTLANSQDKYNMLYSSTETIRPSLYAQTPKIEVTPRHRDRNNPVVRSASEMLESCVQYAIEEFDFDEVMENVIEDYTLPGLGQAWVRYDPTFKDETDDDGNPVYTDDTKKEVSKLLDFEALAVEYVQWKDFLVGPCRTWKECPWVARRVYLTKEEVAARFGADVSTKVGYKNIKSPDTHNIEVGSERQATVWEIWFKKDRKVIWYSEDYGDDVLDIKDDPLRLKGFWPCPRPMRAISNNRTFVPRPFYSQYQNQQEEMDNITARIRLLTNALQVRGVYDASQANLSTLLSATGGNKMVPIQDWMSFAQGGGISGAVDFVPIDTIAKVLLQLYDARDRVKAEIYEITGFGDILRGTSKASETLGAQQIKQDWASARLKKMQKEVQRFARDLVRIMAEVISEHFSDETLALYSGFDPEAQQPQSPMMGHNGGPPLDPQQPPQGMPQPGMPPQGMPPQGMPPQPDPQQMQLQQAIATFKQTVAMLRNERERCAMVGIETDSTILPDEANERKDRMEFLGQIGAFLQQAGPMVMQFPEMRGLLGSIMMFTVRTFRASRPIEEEFEKFQELLAAAPPVDPNKKEGDNGAAAAQASVQTAQIKAQSDQQIAQGDQQTKAAEIQANQQIRMAELELERQKMQFEAQQAQVQLQIAQVNLQIEQAKLQQAQQKINIDAQNAQNEHMLAQNDQQHSHSLETAQQQHSQQQDLENNARADRELEAGQDNPQNGT